MYFGYEYEIFGFIIVIIYMCCDLGVIIEDISVNGDDYVDPSRPWLCPEYIFNQIVIIFFLCLLGGLTLYNHSVYPEGHVYMELFTLTLSIELTYVTVTLLLRRQHRRNE